MKKLLWWQRRKKRKRKIRIYTTLPLMKRKMSLQHNWLFYGPPTFRMMCSWDLGGPNDEKEDKAPPSSTPLEVREAAYLAARERIFSLHEADEKESVLPKSRKVPVVAQRMIAHTLGQKVSSLHIHEKDDKNDDSPVCAPINADETSEQFPGKRKALNSPPRRALREVHWNLS
ncbi:hypothetical protein KSP40_PGU013580 [Platanthera guangdongensis]|uniref:SUZ domain-containing protein n=1 Tax=Platanthera guangdongensis TaxID=2320717 RepID=A0ABR2LCL7_9ASPA